MQNQRRRLEKHATLSIERTGKAQSALTFGFATKRLPEALEQLSFSFLGVEDVVCLYKTSRHVSLDVASFLQRMKTLIGFNFSITQRSLALSVVLRHCKSLCSVSVSFIMSGSRFADAETDLMVAFSSKLIGKNRATLREYVHKGPNKPPFHTLVPSLLRCPKLEHFRLDSDLLVNQLDQVTPTNFPRLKSLTVFMEHRSVLSRGVARASPALCFIAVLTAFRLHTLELREITMSAYGMQALSAPSLANLERLELNFTLLVPGWQDLLAGPLQNMRTLRHLAIGYWPAYCGHVGQASDDWLRLDRPKPIVLPQLLTLRLGLTRHYVQLPIVAPNLESFDGFQGPVLKLYQFGICMASPLLRSINVPDVQTEAKKEALVSFLPKLQEGFWSQLADLHFLSAPPSLLSALALRTGCSLRKLFIRCFNDAPTIASVAAVFAANPLLEVCDFGQIWPAIAKPNGHGQLSKQWPNQLAASARPQHRTRKRQLAAPASVSESCFAEPGGPRRELIRDRRCAQSVASAAPPSHCERAHRKLASFAQMQCSVSGVSPVCARLTGSEQPLSAS